MDKSDLITFCCLSYNHENYIKDLINSIWNQDYKNIEIIALDDGSTDKSVEILNSLANISPCPMKVLTQQNSAKTGANINKLISHASSGGGIFPSFRVMTA